MEGNTVVDLRSPRVEASTLDLAAMITDLRFRSAGGWVEPFVRAPWSADETPPGTPGHVRELGAEFVAVPFGSTGAREGVAPAWRGIVPDAAPDPPHGRAADVRWSLERRGERAVGWRLDDPGAGLRRLRRSVTLHPTRPRVDLELHLEADTPVSLPVALHPTLRIPEHGAIRIEADFAVGYTSPVDHPLAVALPDARFADLSRVPTAAGSVALDTLPLAGRSRGVEQVVLLAGVRDAVRVRLAGGETLLLDWDRGLLPSVMLWISDRGIAEPPWSSRFRGVGIEPCAAAFDFGTDASNRVSPLSADGHPTALRVGRDGVTVRSSLRLID